MISKPKAVVQLVYARLERDRRCEKQRLVFEHRPDRTWRRENLARVAAAGADRESASNEQMMVRETSGAFKRAGADLILSYFARDVIREGF